jgi:hypothetical protein
LPFLRLPPEIQLQIWKYFAHSQPRIVQLRHYTQNGEEREANESVTVLSISQETRAGNFKSHGYVDIKLAVRPLRSRTLTAECKFLFNPSIDLLILDSYEGRRNGYAEDLDGVVDSIKEHHVFEQLRGVTLYWPGHNFGGLLRSLRECEKLELVFVVWEAFESGYRPDFRSHQVKQGTAFGSADDDYLLKTFGWLFPGGEIRLLCGRKYERCWREDHRDFYHKLYLSLIRSVAMVVWEQLVLNVVDNFPGIFGVWCE